VSQPSLFGEPAGEEADAVAEVTVYADGGARNNPGPAAIGVVVKDSSQEPPSTLATVSEYIGETTNNVAEYRAVIAGLEQARRFRPRRLKVRADSLLVVKQLRGEWKIKHEGLQPLHQRARALVREFDDVDIAHVRREYNTEADALVNEALDAHAAQVAAAAKAAE
jgi:ribonuclease HI